MLDYRQMEALAVVVEEGGFEKAASRLHITQSAVSQRIRSLEDAMGQALLVRSSPVRTTEAGQRLLAHFRRVHHLETDLLADLHPAEADGMAMLSIAVNEDSLATWFMPALRPFLQDRALLVDICTDDQEQTHRLLREGRVAGCISTRPAPIQGCACTPLGSMEYRCVCTPAFRTRWFGNGVTAKAIRQTPAVTFNRKDLLHCRFAAAWDVQAGTFPTHYVPSSEVFVEFITAGVAYGMVPHPQARPLLAAGTLCELVPGHAIRTNLYWHHWNLNTPLLTDLSRALLQGGASLLLPLDCSDQ